jgi:bifunctional non-homologous end joining protein LigD
MATTRRPNACGLSSRATSRPHLTPETKRHSMTLPTASLYFNDGKSDKEYHAQVAAQGDGFVVTFQYGRRGAALQAGSKTPAPVPLEKAVQIHGKLVAEKTAKGYTSAEAGVAFQGTDKAGRVTGVLPQLLNAIDELDVDALVSDDAWLAQQKYDGERRLIKRDRDSVVGINRMGLQVPLPVPVEEAALNTCSCTFTLDGEIIGNRVYAFDLISLNGQDLSAEPLERRLLRLEALVGSIPHPYLDRIGVARSAHSTEAKGTLLTELKALGQEGIVFKRKSSTYAHGRPSSGGDHLKFKFVESASLLVRRVNGDKRSVELHAIDADAPDRGIVFLGNVTIPPNHTIPAAGSIVEVRYLYAYKGGSLFQPVYMGERRDIDVRACTTSQLKYKVDHADAQGESAADVHGEARPSMRG